MVCTHSTAVTSSASITCYGESLVGFAFPMHWSPIQIYTNSTHTTHNKWTEDGELPAAGVYGATGAVGTTLVEV